MPRPEKFLRKHSYEQYGFFASAHIRRQLHEFGASGDSFYDEAFGMLDLKKGDRVLDIGTGSGFDLLKLAKQYHPEKLVGLEPPTNHLEDFESRFIPLHDAMQREGIDNIEIVPGYAQQMPFENNSFNKIMAVHSLYEIPDLGRALRETQRVLAPDGKFLVITNAKYNRQRLHAYLREMGIELDSLNPSPFSSRFRYHEAERVLSRYFKVIDRYRHHDSMKITEDRLPMYLEAINTYRSSFIPRILNDGRWARTRDEIVERELLGEIAREGAAYDTIDIGAILCENSYHSPLQRFLGSVGLGPHNKWVLGT